MKILVVEDEKPLAEAIKKKLEVSGFEVVAVKTANQAIEYLENERDVNAAWLDHYLLGQESGIDVLVHMKRPGSPHKDVPVYVVSNTATPDKVEKYLALGADKYYVKSDTRLDEIINDIKDQISN